jgi:alcohol dehydrogenase (cytochrome c)
LRILLFAFLGPILAAQVSMEDLRKSPNLDWLSYIGDYSAHRHSPLSEINPRTISRLAPKWVRNFAGTGDLETVPLVHQGVMYATIPNEVFALDAITGREIWHYRAQDARRAGVNRGVAIFGERIYFETADCHLVALGRTTGAVIWDREYAAASSGYSCTAAPLVVKDKIVVGVASSGQTCFIAALSAETGKEAWRVWTVPRKGEPGSDTWGNFPLENGGAPAWTTGTYDPALNLLYWPTGNPWPDFGGDRPGDNLYSDCVLALDADTGKMKWYFQFVPHDTHDWDANEAPVLLDTTFRGTPRKLLVQANRNGFYYILDRTTGEFLLAEPFVKELNWAKGIDAKGRPIVAPNTDPTPAGVRVCPTVHGATNWWSPSLNAELGLFYVVALEQCETYYSSAQAPAPNSGFRGTGHTLISGEKGQFYLRALDMKTGKLRWEFPMPGPTLMWAGTLSTAGGLVFSADDDGDLVGLDAKSGKALWHFYLGSNLKASPMTFSAGGRQYVTIASGRNLFTFGLVD